MIYDNKYRYIKELGKGGFGMVFLVEEVISKRLVAIKQLNNKDREKQQNIIKEIQFVSKFKHPNIVTFYNHFWQGGLLYLVMEYCEGGSLRDKLATEKIAPVTVLLYIQILAECLELVHEKGIIHHDIKPDNILFTESGTIKITDFGVANTGGGTTRYMCPDMLVNYKVNAIQDPRIDIYALGVTLMELLTLKNPFSFLTSQQIIDKHEKAEFGIEKLPAWHQEIILKAINQIPELRFQHMSEFAEAIKAKAVKLIIDNDILKAASLANIATKSLKTKKWSNAFKYLELANNKYPNNVSVLKTFGKYYLQVQKIKLAQEYFEKALMLNPRLDLQKDLGWINLENKNYPTAISLLSDHLHRNPIDFEAYNLLIQCYYETNRYEPAMELAEMLMLSNPHLKCFANNYYICSVLNTSNAVNDISSKIKSSNNHFIQYNESVFKEKEETYSPDNMSQLKSKLLFMDYQFNDFKIGNLCITNSSGKEVELTKPIAKFGRKGYLCNDAIIDEGTKISRRHCVIINSKNNYWVFDLDSTGTYINKDRVTKKYLIYESCTLKIGNTIFNIKPDKTKLL